MTLCRTIFLGILFVVTSVEGVHAVDLGPPRPAWTARLDELSELSIDETPLTEVLAILEKDLGVNVQLDRKALEEASIPSDQPVTLTVRNMKRRTILNKLLKPIDLAFTVRSEGILITTVEKSRTEIETRFYDVDDLIEAIQDANRRSGVPEQPPGAAPRITGGVTNGHVDVASGAPGATSNATPADPHAKLPREYRELITLTQETIAPDTWEEAGGPGRISVFAGLVVVSQTEELHTEVSTFFDNLRDILEKRRRRR